MLIDSPDSLRQSGKLNATLLDALRGIAALGVYLSHADLACINMTGWIPHWREGVFGVFLFFAISGFLIWSSARQHIGQKSGLSIYAIHRFTRLYPLYIITLLFAVFVLVPVQVSYHPSFTWLGFLRHLVFAQEIDPSISKTLLPVTWSLTCEVAFYILVPLLLVVRRWIPVWITFPLLVAVSIYSNNADFSPVTAISRTMYGFMLGAACAEWPKIRLWLGILCFSLAFSGLDLGTSAFLEMRPLLALGFLAILVSPQMQRIVTSQIGILVLKPFAFVGLVSYSLYLWHTMFINLLFKYTDLGGKFGILELVPAPARGLIFLMLMLGFSWLSFRLIEQPGMRSLRCWLQNRFIANPRSERIIAVHVPR